MAERLKKKFAPRIAAAALLVLVVVAAHFAIAEFVASRAAAFDLSVAMPPRLQVAYVRELEMSAPPARPVPVARAKPAKRMPQPGPVAASAPEPVASAVEPPVAVASAPVEEPPAAASEPVVAAASAAEAPASAASAVAFEWPVSTRLRYVLTGYVRGEVHGQAQVEWIRAGNRYQVHLDVQVGPSFAPLATRRMSSDGEITPDGLAPRRYDQETRLAFDGPYRSVVRFEDERILLANGLPQPRWPGVQDTASQFVQLSWWFDSRPERLRTGETVDLPLAMPRNISVWTYDVLQQETLYTPFGEVPAYHLKPRREARAGGDLVTELWIAPQLRHLPVRFRIHQDAENYVDLMLDRKPELAASEPTPSRTPP